MEEHKDLVDFLQTYYPKEFSIPFPNNIEFDNQIVSNQGNSLSK